MERTPGRAALTYWLSDPSTATRRRGGSTTTTIWCEGDGNAGVGSMRGVVLVSAYMGGTRGSGVLSSACDVLEMSVMRDV